MASIFNYIHICYASETGNAKGLAYQAQQILQKKYIQVTTPIDLDKFDLTKPYPDSLVLFFCSTAGQGEAPHNAHLFVQRMQQVAKVNFSFAIFGLGDTSYSNFCQFAADLQKNLLERNAKEVINLVKADAHYKDFFNTWLQIVDKVIQGQKQVGKELALTAAAYDINNTFSAKVIKYSKLGDEQNVIYKLDLDISGSGIYYQPGDLVYILPVNNSILAEQIVDWFAIDEKQKNIAIAKLMQYELKKIPVSCLRQLAGLINNQQFTELLRIANKQQLADYLYWHDLLDILQHFAKRGELDFTKFIRCLMPLLPRAYSIASIEQNTLQLLIKQISYRLNDRDRFGILSYNLYKQNKEFAIYSRSNPNFHLNSHANVPIIMLATGTGIAPFIGFLRKVEQLKQQDSDYIKPMYLFFGEKSSVSHFLYQLELTDWLNKGILTKLFTAFSRDQAQKVYIHDVFLQQAELINALLHQGAHLYVCGSANIFAKTVEPMLQQILQQVAKFDNEQVLNFINQFKQKQLHFDLF